MAGKAEVQSSGLDTVKLVVALLLAIAAVGAFYYFGEQPLLYRALGLIAVCIVAVGIALTSVQGRRLWGFVQESRTEVRKMVWPTRAETLQTTLIVLLMVLLVGVFLWLLDMFLGWAIQLLIGTGG